MTSGFLFSSSNISLLTFETKNKPYMNLHCMNIWLDHIYYFPLLKDPQSSVLIQVFWQVPKWAWGLLLTIINKSPACQLQLLKPIYVREFSVEMACISCTKLVDLIHQFLTHPQALPRVHSRRWMWVMWKHRWVSQLNTKPLRGVARSDPLVSQGGWNTGILLQRRLSMSDLKGEKNEFHSEKVRQRSNWCLVESNEYLRRRLSYLEEIGINLS